MKTFNRCDRVPANNQTLVSELVIRANECGLAVKDILDVNIGGIHFKELLFTGTRWSYFKYWCTAIAKGEVKVKSILTYMINSLST